MRLPLLLCCLALTACAAAPLASRAPDAGVSAVQEDDIIRPTAKPALSTELLPSEELTGSVKADAELLQRPRAGSVALQRLAAGSRVRLLGTLHNIDGHWVSVGVGDQQGWMRTEQVAQDP